MLFRLAGSFGHQLWVAPASDMEIDKVFLSTDSTNSSSLQSVFYVIKLGHQSESRRRSGTCLVGKQS